MPQGGLEALKAEDPLDILAYQYDIVCNGVELSSGAIRNHRPDIMYKAFSIAGYSREEVDLAYEPTIDPLEQARRFYVRSWQQRHPGRAHMKTGWRRQMRPNRGKSVVEDWNDVDVRGIGGRNPPSKSVFGGS